MKSYQKRQESKNSPGYRTSKNFLSGKVFGKKKYDSKGFKQHPNHTHTQHKG